MKTPIVESLAKHHDRSGFDSGKPSLDNYIRSIASQHQKRSLGGTYVAVDADASAIVMGYYTLAASKVSFRDWPEDKTIPTNMSVPTILLGKLAVSRQFQGHKLGAFLLLHAMWRANQVAQSIGAVALEVDVLDEDALRFYQRYEFDVLQDNPLHLFRTFASIQQLGLDFTSVTRA